MRRLVRLVALAGFVVASTACGGGGQRPPTLGALSPASGGVDGGLLVTLTGERLGLGDLAALGVTFAGTAGTDVTVLDDRTVTCRTPPGPLGPCDVVFANERGETTLEAAFTYYPAPTLAQASPHGGPPEGGFAVTLAGTGFLDNEAGPSTVTVGGVPVENLLVVDDATITFDAPAQPGFGAYDLVVANQNGTAVAVGGFQCRPAPTLAQAAPHGGPLAGGKRLTLTGTGFLEFEPGAPAVLVGGLPATNVVVADDATIACDAPAQPAYGAYDVSVATIYGAAALAGGYETWPAPTLAEVTPPRGPATAGTAMTLSGTGFLDHEPGVPVVLVGGLPATGVAVTSDTTLTCVAPQMGALASYEVLVRTLYGEDALAGAWECVPPPTVTSVTEASGPAGGLTLVTVTGTDLDTGALVVTFDGAEATEVTVVNATTATCLTPEGAQGPSDVAVTTYGGTDTAEAAYEYTVFSPDDPLFGDQWHLDNTAQRPPSTVGEDANVWPGWDWGYTGKGVTIGVVDDGLELLHEDLASNVVPGKSWDYAGDDADPTGEEHGTSVAGVSAAVGANGIGVTGAAPDAGLIGFAVILWGATDADIADALGRETDEIGVYNNSWGTPAYYNGVLYGYGEAPASFHDAVEAGITTGRGGLGCVYMKAAGNWAPYKATFDGTNGVRGVNVIGAVNSEGLASSYSQAGPCVLLCAPSNGSGHPGITTTDRTGSAGYSSTNYTSAFGGTSSATPLVTGVAALLLQMRPDLAWWEVSLILAKSARRNHTAHAGWAQNGAGYWVNDQYGFGVVDAGAALDLGRTWETPGALVSAEDTQSVGQTVPKGNATGVTSTITVPSDTGIAAVHRATVTVDIDHPRASDLTIVLTSPDGTTSGFATSVYVSGATASNSVAGFPMVSWRHLGEAPEGDWTLKITDGQNAYDSTWASWTLTLEGEGTPPTPLVAAMRAEAPRPPPPTPSVDGGTAWWDGRRWHEAVEDPTRVAALGPHGPEGVEGWLVEQTDAVEGREDAQDRASIWRLRDGATRGDLLHRAAPEARLRVGRVLRDGPRGDGRLRVLSGRLLVRVHPTLSGSALARIETRHGLTLVRTQGAGGSLRVYRTDPLGRSPVEIARDLLAEEGVEHAEPDAWVDRAID